MKEKSLIERQQEVNPATPASKGWKITSSNSGLSWIASNPILDPEDDASLHMDYWQFPVL